jgi:hypothetical protein
VTRYSIVLMNLGGPDSPEAVRETSREKIPSIMQIQQP